MASLFILPWSSNALHVCGSESVRLVSVYCFPSSLNYPNNDLPSLKQKKRHLHHQGAHVRNLFFKKVQSYIKIQFTHISSSTLFLLTQILNFSHEHKPQSFLHQLVNFDFNLALLKNLIFKRFCLSQNTQKVWPKSMPRVPLVTKMYLRLRTKMSLKSSTSIIERCPSSLRIY